MVGPAAEGVPVTLVTVPLKADICGQPHSTPSYRRAHTSAPVKGREAAGTGQNPKHSTLTLLILLFSVSDEQ